MFMMYVAVLILTKCVEEKSNIMKEIKLIKNNQLLNKKSMINFNDTCDSWLFACAVMFGKRIIQVLIREGFDPLLYVNCTITLQLLVFKINM